MINMLRIVVFMVLVVVSTAAASAIKIVITEGVEGAFPIAIVPFAWEGQGPPPKVLVANIISSDLGRSGRFKPLPERDLVARPSSATAVKYENWRILGQDYLLVGKIKPDAAGGYEVQFQLLDVYKREQLLGFRIPARHGDLRYVAHQIADIVYEKITGEPGAFNTRIAYVTLERPRGMKYPKYNLFVADADGYNPVSILDSTREILSPSWSPDGQYLTYVSFEKGQRGRSAIYMQHITTGKRELIAEYPGHNGAPSWSPDGKKLALVLSKVRKSDKANYDVYVFDLGSRKLKRMTRHWSIETYPIWSPDGKTLVFTSDRSGRPQLYSMPASGGTPKRLTFNKHAKENDRGVFSPDGKKLAMVSGGGGRYRIAVLDLENNFYQILTNGTLDESPSFAPNGGMIIYATTHNNKQVLAAVSTDGRVKQRIPSTSGSVREPAWSPFVKK